jgi:hypothetical protein
MDSANLARDSAIYLSYSAKLRMDSANFRTYSAESLDDSAKTLLITFFIKQVTFLCS